LRRFRRAVTHLKALEIAPVIEDSEDCLVPARAEQVFAQTCASANHLPEFYRRLDGLCEDEVQNFGNVDSGVEHVD